MLATFTVNSVLDNTTSGDGLTTLREAVNAANQLDDADEIVFHSSLNGGVITITGGNLVITQRVTITGPTGAANRITIHKGSASTATAGLSFSNIELSPTGIQADTGVFNLKINGFTTGIRAVNLTSDFFDFLYPLHIVGNEITNNIYGIAIEDSDIPFQIEGNRIIGTSSALGFGIFIDNSNQILFNLPIKPNIGNRDVVNAGNVIGSFAHGILLQNSSFPELRISGNRIGVDSEPNDSLPLPNGVGISSVLSSQVGRIDGNDVVYNIQDGVSILADDGILIENNLIGANGGDGLDLSEASGSHTIRNNIFDGNEGNGITIHPVTSGIEARNIEITGNDFLGIADGMQPIDLEDDGPTDNDPSDIDDGVNDRQNYPVFGTPTFQDGIWHVPVLLDVQQSSQGKSFRFDFYRYDSSLKNYDFIRSENVTVSPQQDYAGSFAFVDNTELALGDQFAALAINTTSGTQRGNTSEMSPATIPIALIPVGDYDRDGEVDCADYQTWRATFGNSVTPYTSADGNGNGIIDAADYAVWANVYDAIAGGPIGDFNNDGSVNIADYNLWKATFGLTSDLRADANCNGVVDAADYAIWRDTFSSAVGAARFGLLDAAFDPDAPPEVVGFLLSASGTSSFDFVGIVGSGEQLRSIPLAGANTISVTFNQAVIVSQGALQLLNLDGSAPSVTSFSYEVDAQTATWTFATSLADGRYLVRLADSVHNAESEALDGEFTNPWTLTQTGSSVLPSGDGVAGGEFRFRFTVLAGDTDHNNIDGATNYQNWKSTEPGRVYVSTTTDDFDADLSFGDVSLREAVDYANTAAEPTTIELPAGHYYLTRSGTELTTNTEFNDLDIFGNVKIVGAGPGATIIDGGSLTTDDRLFDVANLGVLRVFGATLALGAAPTTSTQRDGGAVRVKDGGQLDLDTVAVVGNETTRAGYGGAIYFAATAHGSITDSVITVNYADNMTGGVYLKGASAPGTGGTVTVTRSIIVNNTAADTNNTDVYAGLNRTFTSGGYNRLGNGATGFTHGVNGDYIKPAGTTVHFVVTSIVDTYDGSADPVNMSVRDTIHLANTTAGTQEIWLPAWDFALTRERTTAANVAEMNVSEGDLDITESAIIRGIGGASGPSTSIAWPDSAAADKVFERLGDYNGNGVVDTSDYVIWQNQLNQTGSGLAADGDDDGDVDQDDYNIWVAYFGYTLQLLDVGV